PFVATPGEISRLSRLGLLVQSGRSGGMGVWALEFPASLSFSLPPRLYFLPHPRCLPWVLSLTPRVVPVFSYFLNDNNCLNRFGPMRPSRSFDIPTLRQASPRPISIAGFSRLSMRNPALPE